MGKFFTPKQQQAMQKAIIAGDEKLRRFGARGLLEMTRFKRFGGFKMPGFTKGSVGRAMAAEAFPTEARIVGGTMLAGGGTIGFTVLGLRKRSKRKKRLSELAELKILSSNG